MCSIEREAEERNGQPAPRRSSDKKKKEQPNSRASTLTID